MDLNQVVDIVARNGFVIIFAVWAMVRLDHFLVKLVAQQAQGAIVQAEMLRSLEQQTQLLNIALRAK